MDLLVELYEKYPEVEKNCHDLAHVIGNQAYLFYESDIDVKISKKSSYCSYGFYHGFMETLIAKSNNPKLAKDFCDKIQKEMNIDTDCYHGMGHGVTLTHEIIEEEDIHPIVERGINSCIKSGLDGTRREQCYDGVFSALFAYYEDPGNKLVFDVNDPYIFCESIKEGERACFMYMSNILFLRTGADFHKTVNAIFSFNKKGEMNSELAAVGVGAAAYMMGAVKAADEDQTFQREACKSLPSDLIVRCFERVLSGMLTRIKPGTEITRLTGFCDYNNFTEFEKENCYSFAAARLKNLYGSDNSSQICSKFPEEFKDNCLSNPRT
jgi:hypothetical protein